MYERHFGLRENPFPAGHQLRFLYPSREHQEARAHLRYGIENREPFVLITGEVGTGKTTALYDALAEWGTQVTVALITNSALTRQELLEEICLRFGLTLPSGQSKPQMLAALERHLMAVSARGEHAVLLLDEAQNLAIDLLEEIRLLSNAETQGEKLIQIFLVGQPELEAKLARTELRQLRQRITVHYRLNPLSPEETMGYIHHRIAVAGGNAIATFPPDACRAVYRVTHGIPREINTVAAQALLSAYTDGAKSVRPEHVSGVAHEIEFHSVLGAPDESPMTDDAPAPYVPPVVEVAAVAAPPTPAPVAPHISDAPPSVPTWSPPELTAEAVAPYVPPVLPDFEEPVGETLEHVEDERELDLVEKRELDAWSRAASDLLEARRLGQSAAGAAGAANAGSPSEPNEPRFPSASELQDMGASADPTSADLSGLPARLREKIEDDIAREERKGGMMPWLLGGMALAASVVALVLLQRFQVIDVPLLRGLASTSAASDSLHAATPAPVTASPVSADTSASGVAAADSVASAAADSAVVIVAPDAPIATKSNPFKVQAVPPVTAAGASTAAGAAPSVAAPTSVFGIGVAAFLDRDRAETERTRLSGVTGLEARIFPFRDGATTMYRLVLGRFPTNAAAERAANGLIQRDQVREARVLVIGSGTR